MTNTGIILASRVSAIALAMATVPVAAQTQSPTQTAQQPPAAAPDSPGGPEDIIVTARKRDERLQDVPVAITAFTAKDIQRYSTRTLADVASLTPGLVIGQTTNPTGNIYLRGIGASDNSPAVDQAVSINVDGVQVSQAQILRLGQEDIQRVEILKGPQALFFGKNSPGGIISIVSADPTDKLEARLRTGYEFYNQSKFVEGMISTPLSDTLGVRIDGYYNSQNGWFQNRVLPGPLIVVPAQTRAPGLDEYSGRLTLAYHPSSFFDAKLKVSVGKVTQSSGPASMAQNYICPNGAPQNSFGLPTADTCKIDRYYAVGDIPANVAALNPGFGNGRPFINNQQTLGSLTANFHPSEQVTITSVTGLYHSTENEVENFCLSSVACLPAGSQLKLNQFTQELRAITSFSGPINVVVGGFYQDFRLANAVQVAFAPPILTPALVYDNFLGRQKTTSYSFFGQAIFKPVEQVEITGGGRYTHETKDQFLSRGPSVLNGFQPTAPFFMAKPSITFTNFSPEATVSYKPSANATIYGAYRQGFVAGGFNIVSFLAPGTDNSYRPETVKGGEVGVKGQFLDRQLNLDTTLYHYTYSQLQLSSFDPVTLSLPVKNAGAATIYGIEASLNFTPQAAPGLAVRGAIAYNHSRYDSFRAGCYGGQTIAQGCNLDFSAMNGGFNSQELAGRSLVNAPRLSGAGGASYEHGISRAMVLTTSFDLNYTGREFTQVEEDPRTRQHSFVKLNASIALRHLDSGWKLAVIGKNLTNKLTVSRSIDGVFTGGGFGRTGPIASPDIYGLVQPPRTIMLELTLTDALFRR